MKRLTYSSLPHSKYVIVLALQLQQVPMKPFHGKQSLGLAEKRVADIVACPLCVGQHERN
jgi:hypothetical protein